MCGIALGYFLHDHVLIIATSFGGAFLFTLGVGTLLNNYPDIKNAEMYSKLDPKMQDEMNRRFLTYFGLFVLLGTVGAIVQYKKRDADKLEAQNQASHSPEHKEDKLKESELKKDI